MMRYPVSRVTASKKLSAAVVSGSAPLSKELERYAQLMPTPM